MSPHRGFPRGALEGGVLVAGSWVCPVRGIRKGSPLISTPILRSPQWPSLQEGPQRGFVTGPSVDPFRVVPSSKSHPVGPERGPLDCVATRLSPQGCPFDGVRSRGFH